MLSDNLNKEHTTDVSDLKVDNSTFWHDVKKGLTSNNKYLQAKYFYDDEGDHLFQQIMNCKEYYPFDCELEIFSKKTQQLAQVLMYGQSPFELIELGAGDCTKTKYLLRELIKTGAAFTYRPIDISTNIIKHLNKQLPIDVPGLKMSGLNGEYFKMLERVTNISNNRKVVLFLGSNLGNMPPDEAENFCRQLRSHLRADDLAIIGIDLKKHPGTILAAYNDKNGLTKEFNLNLLRRINREFQADFDIGQFEHYPVYDPGTGACKSYLISLMDQEVNLFGGNELITVNFKENEEIFMEISQKFSVKEVAALASQASFRTVINIYDEKKWFLDAIWQASADRRKQQN